MARHDLGPPLRRPRWGKSGIHGLQRALRDHPPHAGRGQAHLAEPGGRRARLRRADLRQGGGDRVCGHVRAGLGRGNGRQCRRPARARKLAPRAVVRRGPHDMAHDHALPPRDVARERGTHQPVHHDADVRHGPVHPPARGILYRWPGGWRARRRVVPQTRPRRPLLSRCKLTMACKPDASTSSADARSTAFPHTRRSCSSSAPISPSASSPWA